ncbi:hypothetical protein ACS0TY_031312 [Phlomoides rotata]
MLSNRNAFKSLIQSQIISCRWYYTRNQKSLYAKISPLGNPNVNVTPELDKWVEMGNKVRFAELQRIIIDLRKRKRYNQALQVSEWMRSKDIYTFTPVQHAVQLDLIGKVHGLLHAESYFDSLSEQDKTEKVYGAILHCYVRQRETERALKHLKSMKEKGLALSSVAFNDIMTLYTSIGEYDKVPGIFKQMKEHSVQPDNLSYRICINSFGVRSDIEGLKNILSEMENDGQIVMDWNTYAVVANFHVKAGLKCEANIFLEKAEKRLDKKDALCYNHLISIHARLGNRDDVSRLWSLEKTTFKRCHNREYINMMESLVRLDELEEAEKVLKEWESSGNCYDIRVPSAVINGYIEKGLCDKAETVLRNLMETGKVLVPNIWGRLARGYIEMGKMGNAVESLKTALSEHDVNEGNNLHDKVITDILRSIGVKGSSADAERVVNLLRSKLPLKRLMYHTLLKCCVNAGKEVGWLLNIMKSDNYEEDEETLKILSSKQNDV